MLLLVKLDDLFQPASTKKHEHIFASSDSAIFYVVKFNFITIPDTQIHPGLQEPGVPQHPQILADQLTLSQPEGADYAHQITTGTPGFSDLPTTQRRVGKMMPTYHMYPHSTASSFSTLRPCFRVNFYSVALKLSCNMCVVPTRETFCGSQVAVLA